MAPIAKSAESITIIQISLSGGTFILHSSYMGAPLSYIAINILS